MASEQPKVLIVILNYGTYEMTLDLIRALRSGLTYPDYTVMVVDNASPGGAAEKLQEMSGEMGYVFYANKTNAGYAAGNNIGIRYGIEHGFAYTWILNNDVVLREKTLLAHMVGVMEADPRIGCAGPVIYSPEGNICAPYCRRPTFWSMTGGIRAEKKYRNRFKKQSGEVYRVYGCCMLVRNSAMAEVDCMDERTFLFGEEDILAERLTAKGYTTYYDADVSITHLGSATVKNVSKKKQQFKARETEKSLELYLKEYRHFSPLKRFVCRKVRSLIIYLR